MKIAVTTIYKPPPAVAETAARFAAGLGAPLVPREKCSLAVIREQTGAENLLVVTKSGPLVYTAGGEYFFHLSMAQMRINNIINGKHDHMITAMGLRAGMSVLDCTLGLATDAVVASFAAGETGRITGLEASPVIAAVTGYGLANFVSDRDYITAALRRITAQNADYNNYLPTLPDKSFDIVFFDPMFRSPVRSSSNLKPIRRLADQRPLDGAAVREAKRVARRRVVLKEASGSGEFARLGFAAVVGGRYSSIHYGVIEVEGADG